MFHQGSIIVRKRVRGEGWKGNREHGSADRSRPDDL